MDSEDKLSGPHRDDHGEPQTPESNVSTYTRLGVGGITSPQGRVLRPPSAASRQSSAAASRRSSAFGLASRSASSALGLGQENDITDLSSLADRLARWHSPQGTLEVTENQEETEVGRSSRPSSRSLSRGSGAHDDAPDRRGNDTSAEEQDERKDSRKSGEEKLLLDNEKLRLDRAQLEKDIKVLERQWDEQADEIRELRAEQKATELSAERRQLDMLELQMSKEDADKELEISEARVAELEEQVARLRRLEGVQEKLNKAEWQLGDYYNELEGKEAEFIRLRQEVEELKASNGPLERALQRSEQERDNLNAEMQTVLQWMEKLHEQQVKSDIDQFREYDNQLLERLDRREAARNRGSVGSSPPQHEVLGDFMSSRPQSLTSQSRISLVPHGLDAERGVRSRPQSTASCVPESAAVHSSPRPASMAPAASSQPDDGAYHQRRESRRISFQGLNSRQHFDIPPIHRRLELLRRRTTPPTSSRLRHSSIPAESRLDAFFRPSNVPSSPSLLDLASTDVSEGLSSRALSAPITKEEHAELREYVKVKFPVPITWENAKTRAVFEPEHTTPPEESQAVPLEVGQAAFFEESLAVRPGESQFEPLEESQGTAPRGVASLASPFEWQILGLTFGNSVSKHPQRRTSQQPAAITMKLEGPSFDSSKDSVQASAEVAKYVPSSPLLADSSRNSNTAELIKATGSSSPVSPLVASSGLRKRRGDFSSVTALGSPIAKSRDLFDSLGAHSPTSPTKSPNMKALPSPRSTSTSTTPRSPYKIPLPASDNEAEGAGTALITFVDAFEPLPLYKRRDGGVRKPALRRIRTGPVLSAPRPVVTALSDEVDIDGLAAQQQVSSDVAATTLPQAALAASQTHESTRSGAVSMGIHRSEADVGPLPRYTEGSADNEQKGVDADRETRPHIVAGVLVAINIAMFLAAMLVLYTNLSVLRAPTPVWTSAPASACPPRQIGCDNPDWESCNSVHEVHFDKMTDPLWMTSTLTETSTEIITERATETQTKTETETSTKIDYETHTKIVVSTELLALTTFETQFIATETEVEVETFTTTSTSTLVQTQTETEISTSTATATVTKLEVEVETETETLIKTHTFTETGSLALCADPHFPRDLPILPPTRSFTGAQFPSFMLMDPASGHPKPVPAPRPVPSTGISHSSASPCECACPHSHPVPSSTSTRTMGLTNSQIDARAAKVKQRTAQSQMHMQHNRAYLGRTYWGFIPEVQRFLDIVHFEVTELLLGGTRGMRKY
ncbi:hypothetical protein G647_03565 [Cladophialophora carrionii CBS 160.54]|uniref:Uncharacterized protein n=1 Tax=Cladophialophora carrionii CBS 160.54 TaxID=1279043 RepID=V9DBW4_9EURO|nr:uncharacterized protein G647_03565 [Cladophialophora carrionii CBS 160.54]ETI24196.1 hypothetical protein G647_03565 [Cladophialophora carrionii CBS 160.54]